MIDHLKSKVTSDKMKDLQLKLMETSQSHLKDPHPVKGLIATTKPRRYHIDPTQKISHDIVDHKGQILARAGDQINPFKHISLQKGLLFIFGDNPSHVAWAQQHAKDYHVILVNGSPHKIMENHIFTCYFDQGGHITQHYGIQQIPARIDQEGMFLQVSEFVIEDAQ